MVVTAINMVQNKNLFRYFKRCLGIVSVAKS